MSIGQNIAIDVHTRAAWADAWTARATLEPVRASAGVAPTIGEAVLQHRYGNIKPPTGSAFSVVAPLDIVNHYARIRNLSAGVEWYGVLAQESHDLRGCAAGATPVGMQTFEAVGLEHLLDRVHVDRAWASNGGEPQAVNRTVVFNQRAARAAGLLGNRSAEKHSGCYYFNRDGHLWSARDVCEYLLVCLAPVGPAWALGGLVDDLEQMYDVWDLDGMTLWQAFQRLIDRRRGYGFRVDATDTTATITVFSVLNEDVIVNGSTFHANAAPLELVSDDDPLIASAPVILDQSAMYDRIRVRGARVKSVFTVSVYDETLVKGWTNADEAEYVNPTGITGATYAEQMRRQDDARAVPRLSRVFSVFRLPPQFDWFVGGGTEIEQPMTTANPEIDDDGEPVAVSAPAYDYGRPLLPNLPLMEGIAYHTNGWPTDPNALPESGEPAQLKPLVLVLDTSGKWRRVDDLHDSSYPDATVEMLPQEAAFAVRFRPAHILARGSWNADARSYWIPGYSWTDLLATIAVETDEHLQVVVERDGDVPDFPRELLIDVPDAELWYAPQNTVVGLSPSGELRRIVAEHPPHTGPAILRSDAAQLRIVAQLALQWYGRPRAAVSMTRRELTALAAPGTLITGIRHGSATHTVNSVVSARAWDFIARTTTIRTGWWDLDARTVGMSPRIVDPRRLSRLVDSLDRTQRQEAQWHA